MAPIDLKLFCDTTTRRTVNLSVPSSFEDWTFASNGHVLIRVKRVPEWPDGEPGIWRRALEWMSGPIDTAETFALPKIDWPKTEKDECDDCRGTGDCCDCPNCEAVCESCEGSGWTYGDPPVADFGNGVLVSSDHIKLVAPLPSVRITATPNANGHIRFVFDGGEGLIMPMRYCGENRKIPVPLAA